MPKYLKLVIAISLTCAVFSSHVHARRMSPEAIKAQEEAINKAQPDLAQTPESVMMKPPVIFKTGNGAQDAHKLESARQRVWQPQVNDLATWQQLAKPMRDAEYSKFVIDLKTHHIYFVDANVFTLHIDFVMDYLQKTPRTPANIKAYNRNYSTQKPQFILGYLTHYPKQDTWTFSFWEGDTIQANAIASVAKQLASTFKVAPLKYRPDSSYQERVALDLKRWHVPVIKNAAIYKAMPYQAFNVGQAVGKLNIVPTHQKLENMQFAQEDIVVLQQSYPDISPVAGIITTQFSTPLSHVNLRANAWNIPNASLKMAAKNYASLNGKWVKLIVTEQSLTLNEASLDEIRLAQSAMLAQKNVELPPVDLLNTSLNTLQTIHLEDIHQYGAKTAHLGEMLQAGLPVPQGFGIPFYYYQHHMQKNGLDKQLAQMLNNPQFKQPIWRKAKLAEIQQKIQASPIDAQDFLVIERQWKTALNSAPVFARSSTNAEDLAGFNGAGLYDSVPNIKTAVALQAGIKKVWASLWNARAVDERAFFGIPQTQVYAAVLIQTGVNANASGVLLTTDIWGHQARTFTINAKWGLGLRLVEGQKMAEQILYDTNNEGSRVISRSDENTMLVFDKAGGIKEVSVPKVEAIINEKRAKQLGVLAQKVEALFPQYTTLDIEWVLEKDASGGDRFWLVQARPYVGR